MYKLRMRIGSFYIGRRQVWRSIFMKLKKILLINRATTVIQSLLHFCAQSAVLVPAFSSAA